MTDVREDLKAYVDGELSPSRIREVEAAIAADPSLRAEVDYLRRLSFEITQVARDVDIRGASETLARLRRPRRNVFLAPILGAIGCLAVIAVTYPLWQTPFATAKSSVVIQGDKGANLASAPKVRTMDANQPTTETFRGLQGSVTEQSKAKGLEAKKSLNRTGGTFERAGVAPATSQAAVGGGAAVSGMHEVVITVASLESARQTIRSFEDQVPIGAATPTAKFANPSRVDGDRISIQVPENKVAETLLAIQGLDIAREREKTATSQGKRTYKPEAEGSSVPPASVSSNSAPRLITIHVQLRVAKKQR